jgi:hypothetical protein
MFNENLGAEAANASQQSFDRLLSKCAPATSGKRQEAVCDKSYRKAVNLDKMQFAVWFNPYVAEFFESS